MDNFFLNLVYQTINAMTPTKRKKQRTDRKTASRRSLLKKLRLPFAAYFAGNPSILSLISRQETFKELSTPEKF